MDVLLTECRPPLSLRAPDPALSVALTALIADLPGDIFLSDDVFGELGESAVGRGGRICVDPRIQASAVHGTAWGSGYVSVSLERGVGAEVDRGQKKARGRAGKP